MLPGAIEVPARLMGAIAATTRSGGNVTITSVPIRNLDFRAERSTVKVHQALGDWQTEARSLFRRFD